MDNITTIGLDISKQAFHAVRLDETNTVDLRRKFRRAQLAAFFENLDGCAVVMEACGSAHYWARKFETMGHVVKLLPAQHVKGYLRGQKNDFKRMRTKSWNTWEVVHVLIRRAPSGGEAVFNTWEALQGYDSSVGLSD